MKTLLIGAYTEGIGDAFLEEWNSRNVGNLGDLLFAPTIAELDVTDQDSMATYLWKNGPFDEIVYSAGVNWLRAVVDITPGMLVKTFEVNTFGFPLLLGTHMILFPEARGRAVQVVSDAAHTPMRNSLAYCASKAAAEMSVRVLARELFPQWTVLGVNPGVVDETGMSDSVDAKVRSMRGWTPAEAEAYEKKNSVLGRRVRKAEIADLLWYALRGPEALNGSIININGGK